MPDYSQQDVIKKFMASLDNTTLSGTAALDEAIKVCSNFKGAQDVINHLISDCKTATNADDFLINYCGIILDNKDTGAITGSDAGGSTTKTAESVLPETGTLKSFTGNSFTVNGLTLKLVKCIPNTDYIDDDDEEYIYVNLDFNDLTASQKYMWQGLYTWWAKGSLDLIAASYGNNYGFDSNSSATGNTMGVYFDEQDNDTLAYASWYYYTDTGKMTPDDLRMEINLKYYDSIDTSDPNGKSADTSAYLDRTLSHEFTHAVMAANISYFNKLPQFIKEGMAELTHGIDDERQDSIESLASSPSELKAALDLNDTGTGKEIAYSAGYMFLRYLAKQSATEDSTDTDNIIDNTNRTVKAGGTYKIAQDFTGKITINTTDAVTIDGGGVNFSDVNIITSSNTADLTIKDLNIKNTNEKNIIKFGKLQDNKLTILGTNILSNSKSASKAGINIGGGLTIDGTGSLTTELNNGGNHSAAIGVDYNEKSSANITINGGTIMANAKWAGSGIGGSFLGSLGNITINGGNITAYSEISTGIGGGDECKAGDITIGGDAIVVAESGPCKYGSYGAAIGAGKGTINDYYTGASCGNIVIKDNANVTAIASDGAGIGSGGNDSSVKDITIEGNAVVVAKSNNGSGIGNGVITNFIPIHDAVNSVGNITIQGNAHVTATSAEYGSGIGGGYVSAFDFDDTAKSYGKSTVGNIKIQDKATVVATGEKNNIGIGSGYTDGECTSLINSITISDSTKVTINSDDSSRQSQINNKNYSGSNSIFANGKYIGGSSENCNILNGTSKVDTLKNYKVNTTINADDGSDSIYNYSSRVLINAGVGHDYIRNDSSAQSYIIRREKVTIDGGEGSDYIYNYYCRESSLFGGAGSDIIYNSGKSNNTTIDGGSGNDNLTNAYGKYYSGSKKFYEASSFITFIGGDGDDNIRNEYGDNVTITGGTGNDSIYNLEKSSLAGNNGDNVIYQYSKGDGNDTIRGYREANKIQILKGSYSSVKSGNDVILKVGEGSITLLDAVGIKLNIEELAPDPPPAEEGKKITNSKAKISLTGGTGNDSISNSGNDVTISASAGNDSIKNSAYRVLINAGEGNDTIRNGIYGDSSSINGEAGNDYIYNDYYSHNSKIDGGAGNDTIINNNSSNVIISGGTGDDSIQLDQYNRGSTEVVIKYSNGDGNDTIYGYNPTDSLKLVDGTISGSIVSGNDLILKIGDGSIKFIGTRSVNVDGKIINPSSTTGTSGKDIITNFTSNVTINTFNGNDSVSNSGEKVSINSGNGNNFIKNYSKYTTITTGTGNDTILGAEMSSNSINTGAGNDYIDNNWDRGNSTINTGEGDDTVYNGGSNVIDLGAGNDFIYNTNWGTRSKISAGAGNDTVYNYEDSVSISGGTGNDLIYSSGKNNVIQYLQGDGNDTIFNLNSDDTIQITATEYSSVFSGKDLLISVGNDTINVKNSKNSTPKIKFIPATVSNDDTIDNKTSGILINTGIGNDSITNSGSKVTIDAGADNDTVENSGLNVSINGGNGNNSISNANNNSTIITGNGNDTILNKNKITDQLTSNTYINAGDGNDYISNEFNFKITILGGAGNDTITGSYVYDQSMIDGGDGDDYIYSGSSVSGKSLLTVKGGAGNDSIRVSGGLILAGEGNDSIIIHEGETTSTISGGTGNDIVSVGSSKQKVLFQYAEGDGNDTIYGYNTTDSLKITGDYKLTRKGTTEVLISVDSGSMLLSNFTADTLNINGKKVSISSGNSEEGKKITNSKSKISLTGGKGNDTISNKSANYVLIDAGAGNDSIHGISFNNYNTILAGEGNDTVSGGFFESYIDVGNGNDFITIGGAGGSKGNTYNLGDGDDTIYVSVFGSISGGTGNDIINLGKGNPFTVNAGKGDDQIYAQAESYVSTSNNTRVYEYVKGDGNDTIYGYGENDSLKITGGYKIIGDDKNVTVSVGSGSILLSNYGMDTLNINGKIVSVPAYSPDPTPDTVRNSTQGILINTGAGDDRIYNYYAGEDVVIYAGEGNDTVYNAACGVKINGGAGDDSISFRNSYVTVLAGDGNDTIRAVTTWGSSINAGTGDDIIKLEDERSQYDYPTHGTITAGKGNDTIYNNPSSTSGGSAFVYDTGDGNDVILGYRTKDSLKISGDYTVTRDNNNNVIVNVGSGSILLGNFTADTLNINGKKVSISSGESSDPKLIIGTEYADRISNTISGATIQALGGNDSINNYGSNVKIDSGNDNDYVYNNSKGTNAEIYTGAGNDSVMNYGQKVYIELGEGSDYVLNWGKNATIDGGAGADHIRSDADYSSVNGGAGNDYIYNQNSYVTLTGNDGDDTLYSNYGSKMKNLVFDGGAGNDYITVYSTNSTINGGKDNDRIYFYGSAKNNIIQYEEGDGNDTIYGYGTTDSLKITGDYKLTRKGTTEVLISVGSGSMLLSNFTADTLNINGKQVSVPISLPSALPKGYKYGTAAKNSTDTKILTASVVSAAANVDLNETYGNSVITLDASKVTVASSLIGNSKSNLIKGGRGADTITGGSGNDTLSGGAGKDIFIYSSGNDLITDYVVGQDKIVLNNSEITNSMIKGSDVILYTDSGSITVKSGKGKKLTVTDSEGYTTTKAYGLISYNADKTEITLSSLFGTQLKSTDYDSTVKKIDASAAIKTVNISGNAQDNTILGGGKAEIIYGGVGNDSINGNAGNDRIFGDSGNDELFGGAGNDTLNGGAGNNTLTGGAGRDVFAYSGGNDTITDYAAGQDNIRITSGTITKTTYSGNDVIFSVGNNSITVQNGKGKKISITDANNKTTIKTYSQNISYSASTNSMWFTEDDNNFITDDTQISEVTKIADSNYSAEQTEIFQNTNELVVTDTIVSSINSNKK